MSAYAYDNKDPELFTVWWLNEERDADMDCGSYKTEEEALKALPGILAELLNQCCSNEEQESSIRAGDFFLEYPEADGERGQTVRMDWPREDA